MSSPKAVPGAEPPGGELRERGQTAVAVVYEHTLIGVLGVASELRPGAREADATAVTPVLLTGDNPVTARLVAERVGITDVRAGLLPEDKLTAVRGLAA